MPQTLARLLESYAFLQSALKDHRFQMAADQINDFERRLDRTFLEILKHSSAEPRVTITQLRFLMTQLVGMAADPDRAAALRTLCQQHLDHLAAALATAPAPSPALAHPGHEYAYLDSLRDRVALIGRDYRYKFTNAANANYHNETQQSFVGRPNWLLVSDNYFETVSKPRFDACFAGETRSFVSAHQHSNPARLFAVNFDPVRNAIGEVEAVMVSCRDVTGLEVPTELVIPLR